MRFPPAGPSAGVLPRHLHLQASFPFLVFRVQFGELGLNPARVDVGVEVGHDGKDEAHHHQQGGEEDVLGPLRRKHSTQRDFVALIFIFHLKANISQRPSCIRPPGLTPCEVC